MVILLRNKRGLWICICENEYNTILTTPAAQSRNVPAPNNCHYHSSERKQKHTKCASDKEHYKIRVQGIVLKINMKQKVVVKIFLPNTKTPPTSYEREFLYGEIKCEYEYGRECRQVLIFVTSRRPEIAIYKSARTQLIGEISANQTKHDQKDVAKDYVWLEYNSDAPDVIRLTNILLTISAPDPEYLFKVQIILYEPKTFLKLSSSDEEIHQNTAVLDPIAYLIKLLRRSEIPNKPPTVWCRRLQYFLLLTLMTVNRVLLHKLLRINESAFLRHFSIWLHSIKLFTFKRFVTSHGALPTFHGHSNKYFLASFRFQWKSMDYRIRCHLWYDSNADFIASIRSRRISHEIHRGESSWILRINFIVINERLNQIHCSLS